MKDTEFVLKPYVLVQSDGQEIDLKTKNITGTQLCPLQRIVMTRSLINFLTLRSPITSAHNLCGVTNEANHFCLSNFC